MAEIRKDHNCRFYRVWCHMKHRCLNSHDKAYKNYGGRGITVCQEWMQFDNFRRDMEDTYQSNLTLDRINNNGNYCKENCRWVNHICQNNNRRSNRLITYKNQTKTLAEWIKYLSLKSSTVRQRLYVLKWDICKSFEYRRIYQ